MFKLDLSPSYFYPVKLPLLDADGKLETRVFDARFRRYTQAQGEELAREATAGRLDDRQLVEQALVGWRGLQDADGNDLPYTPENLAVVLAIAGMRAALVSSFLESQHPRESAALAAKN